MSLEHMEEQFKSLLYLRKENDDLRAEIVRLKQQLADKSQQFEPSNEEAICQIQIEKLREKAFQRELTLEETKRLEILVKSLHSIREKDTGAINADFKVLPFIGGLAELTRIASAPDPEDPDADS